MEVLLRLAMGTEWLPRQLFGRGEAADRLAIEAMTARSPESFLDRRLTVPLEWDADLGWKVRANLVHQQEVRGVGLVVATTTPEGYRDNQRAPDGLTVLALGDSFAFGTEVDDDDVWAERVARARPDLDLINAAVPGYGQDQMWMRFRQLGPALSPALVVLPWIDADLVRNTREVFVWFKPKFEVEQGFAMKVVTPPTVDGVVWRYRLRPRTFDVLRVTGSLLWPAAQVDPKPVTVAIARQLIDDVASMSAQLLLVRAPVPWQLDEGRERYEQSSEAQIFAAVCESGPVHCVDAGEVFFDAHEQGHTLRHETHWDVEGQQLFGDAVLEGMGALRLVEE